MVGPRSTRRALVVNAYFGESRRGGRETRTVLRSMGPQFLAGWLSPDRWAIRLHDEHTGGPLTTPEEIGDIDLLVLTGLTSGLDRMLHLAALAKTGNPRCVTVAGGPAVRSAPRFCAERFDYACLGDVEELSAVVTDAFGPGSAAAEWTPRFELAPWGRRAVYAESSRACNFHCSFCSLTGEKRPYERYDLATLRRQIDAQPRRRLLVLIDNNFFGPDRAAFEDRVDLLRELRDERRFDAWGALVTADFFDDRERVRRAAASGCRALFSGIESFDAETLVGWQKRQNVGTPPVDVLRTAVEAGILPIYGLVLDVIHRTVPDLVREVSSSLSGRNAIVPGFVGGPIPYPGTPFFRQCAASRRLLPGTRVRDLNGSTLCVLPRDGVDAVAAMLRDLGSLAGMRLRALRATAAEWFRGRLSVTQLAIMTARNFSILMRRAAGTGSRGRTFVGPTEALDELYRPKCAIAPEFRKHFEPTMVTDESGGLAAPFAAEPARAPDAVVTSA